MHYLIYKITNVINGKIYIGAHRTEHIDDSYMGSGRNIKLAIKKYGKENFIKEILHDFDNPNDMYMKERELVSEDFVKQPNTYNCSIGGRGSYVFLDAEEKQKYAEKISTSQKKRYSNGAEPWNKGRVMPEHEREHLSNKLSGKLAGVNNPMYGKSCFYKMTDEEKTIWAGKIKKANTGKKRTDEHKKNYSKSASARLWLIHKSGKLAHTQNPDDPRFNEPDWQRGRKWINNKE